MNVQLIVLVLFLIASIGGILFAVYSESEMRTDINLLKVKLNNLSVFTDRMAMQNAHSKDFSLIFEQLDILSVAVKELRVELSDVKKELAASKIRKYKKKIDNTVVDTFMKIKENDEAKTK